MATPLAESLNLETFLGTLDLCERPSGRGWWIGRGARDYATQFCDVSCDVTLASMPLQLGTNG
jgi:hypothetical protein